MTIDSFYFCDDRYQVNDQTVFDFIFESKGVVAIDVYSVAEDGTYTLLTLGTDYGVRLPDYRDPLFYRGEVELLQPISGAGIAILRNTPATTEFDPQVHQPLKLQELEYNFDTICMIQQELECHLCDCRGPEWPPVEVPCPPIEGCEEYACDAYEAEVIDLGLQSIITYWDVNNTKPLYPFASSHDKEGYDRQGRFNTWFQWNGSPFLPDLGPDYEWPTANGNAVSLRPPPGSLADPGVAPDVCNGGGGLLAYRHEGDTGFGSAVTKRNGQEYNETVPVEQTEGPYNLSTPATRQVPTQGQIIAPLDTPDIILVHYQDTNGDSVAFGVGDQYTTVVWDSDTGADTGGSITEILTDDPVDEYVEMRISGALTWTPGSGVFKITDRSAPGTVNAFFTRGPQKLALIIAPYDVAGGWRSGSVTYNMDPYWTDWANFNTSFGRYGSWTPDFNVVMRNNGDGTTTVEINVGLPAPLDGKYGAKQFNLVNAIDNTRWNFLMIERLFQSEARILDNDSVDTQGNPTFHAEADFRVRVTANDQSVTIDHTQSVFYESPEDSGTHAGKTQLESPRRLDYGTSGIYQPIYFENFQCYTLHWAFWAEQDNTTHQVNQPPDDINERLYAAFQRWYETYTPPPYCDDPAWNPDDAPECQPYECDTVEQFLSQRAGILYWLYNQGGDTPSVGDNDFIICNDTDENLFVDTNDRQFNHPEASLGGEPDHCLGGYTWSISSKTVFHSVGTDVPGGVPVRIPLDTWGITYGAVLFATTGSADSPAVQCRFQISRISQPSTKLTFTPSVRFENNAITLRYDGALTTGIPYPAKFEGQLVNVVVRHVDGGNRDPEHWKQRTGKVQVFINGELVYDTDDIAESSRPFDTWYTGYMGAYVSGGTSEGTGRLANFFMEFVEWTDEEIAAHQLAFERNFSDYAPPEYCDYEPCIPVTIPPDEQPPETPPLEEEGPPDELVVSPAFPPGGPQWPFPTGDD